MKFPINYNAHSSAVSPGSGVWLEGSGRGGRLGAAAAGSAGEASEGWGRGLVSGEASEGWGRGLVSSAEATEAKPASTALSGAEA